VRADSGAAPAPARRAWRPFGDRAAAAAAAAAAARSSEALLAAAAAGDVAAVAAALDAGALVTCTDKARAARPRQRARGARVARTARAAPHSPQSVSALNVRSTPSLFPAQLGDTPLHEAARGGHADAAEALLARGAPVDRANQARTHAHARAHACRVGPQQRTLTRARASAFARAQTGWTPLHYAAHKGHADVADALLCAGAHTGARITKARVARSNQLHLRAAPRRCLPP
jgi:ankyrin repeat protein